jgi:hypothetical protein
VWAATNTAGRKGQFARSDQDHRRLAHAVASACRSRPVLLYLSLFSVLHPSIPDWFDLFTGRIRRDLHGESPGVEGSRACIEQTTITSSFDGLNW